MSDKWLKSDEIVVQYFTECACQMNGCIGQTIKTSKEKEKYSSGVNFS